MSSEQKSLRTLRIDPLFKNLIAPLKKKEYLQLEENILSDGCREPIIVWKDFIIDGHNRYEICMRHQIPFAVEEKVFDCREDAIVWICANQLGRRNISEETRRFLIGKQYNAEKIAARIKNPRGANQHSAVDEVVDMPNTHSAFKGHHAPTHTAVQIAKDNNISRATVEKYAIYSRALDTLSEKEPDIVPKILSGQYKISHKNVVELSKLNPPEIRRVGRRLQKMQEPFVQFNKVRDVISSQSDCDQIDDPSPSVKDMPAFDPDADINVLSLTIPSWSSSISRVRTKTDLSIVTENAKLGLIHELQSLLTCIKDMLEALEVK